FEQGVGLPPGHTGGDVVELEVVGRRQRALGDGGVHTELVGEIGQGETRLGQESARGPLLVADRETAGSGAAASATGSETMPSRMPLTGLTRRMARSAMELATSCFQVPR